VPIVTARDSGGGSAVPDGGTDERVRLAAVDVPPGSRMMYVDVISGDIDSGHGDSRRPRR